MNQFCAGGVLLARVIWGFILLSVVATISVASEESITVASWGGAYEKVCREAYFDTFEEATGIKVNVDAFNGGLAQIRAQVDSEHVRWDVVDIESQDGIIGCDEGLLELLEELSLPDGLDGSSAEEDFLEGALTDCTVSHITWSTVIAYNEESFESNPPSSVKDFFDLEKYPGKRAIRRTPEVNLEFALMADGVPIDEIYATLSTSAGVERAFAKLDSIKDSLIIWETGAQPPQLLADEEVIMSTVFNGRIFDAQVLENQPFVIIWDGQVRDFSRWAIVAGTSNLENALKFVQHTAQSGIQAGFANRMSYGPARHSAWPLVQDHVSTGIDMRPHMPTHPDNSKNVLVNDADWWADHKDELTERFSTWLSN